MVGVLILLDPLRLVLLDECIYQRLLREMLGELLQISVEHAVRNAVASAGCAPSVLDAAEVGRSDDDDDVRTEQFTRGTEPIPQMNVGALGIVLERTGCLQK